MHKNLYTLVLLGILLSSCRFPTTQEAGIKYSTKPAFQVPSDIKWKAVGLAKELVNVKEKMVIISGGSNPLPLSDWEDFKVRFPWQKNIDRHILINKTALLTVGTRQARLGPMRRPCLTCRANLFAPKMPRLPRKIAILSSCAPP